MADEDKESGTELRGNKLIWLAGAVVLLIAGWFGLRAIFGSMESYKVTLIDAPNEVNAGTTATFTWRVDGPATTINQTAIRLGSVSQPGELGKDVKPENTQYSLFVQDFASGEFNIPLQFVGNIAMPNPGVFYYRVQALVKDKNYWSDEYTLEVKQPEYKVSIVDAPTQGTEGSVLTFTWDVSGVPTTINHTSVHFSTESTPGELAKNVAPDATSYEDLIQDFAKGTYNIPFRFIGNHTFDDAGTLYYRAHAIINNEHYWTEEKTIEISPAGRVSPTEVPEATDVPEEE
ncbi:MAG: hypothetical protein UV73_C0011G0022 [Candidatus Gottesmanbacteria bacterium GW2011_GWA2_43_14]|uniref:Uncharacterized protein n=1 Tax=Candidatus Gottesmanbacteria bacterium GW2011_GWA2_43_14 TaxID=1618443 RepID=A0A0G1DEM3_9BACT|nr:MAG: hypothetical protein UV73_C0011G0022 [Candidatus Gottesmanbacteria bacterium GW2011_GWA2_43_14]